VVAQATGLNKWPEPLVVFPVANVTIDYSTNELIVFVTNDMAMKPTN